MIIPHSVPETKSCTKLTIVSDALQLSCDLWEPCRSCGKAVTVVHHCICFGSNINKAFLTVADCSPRGGPLGIQTTYPISPWTNPSFRCHIISPSFSAWNKAISFLLGGAFVAGSCAYATQSSGEKSYLLVMMQIPDTPGNAFLLIPQWQWERQIQCFFPVMHKNRAHRIRRDTDSVICVC